ncbi:MAG: ABC transporter substrate-binding protein, partial [bacterium]
SIHDVILTDCLDRFGLKDAIEVINYKWADMITEAMVKREVSAAVGTPALAVAIKLFAGGKVLFPPSMLWPSNPSYGIVASERMIKDNGPLIEKFLSVHEEASKTMRESPKEAAKAGQTLAH